MIKTYDSSGNATVRCIVSQKNANGYWYPYVVHNGQHDNIWQPDTRGRVYTNCANRENISKDTLPCFGASGSGAVGYDRGVESGNYTDFGVPDTYCWYLRNRSGNIDSTTFYGSNPTTASQVSADTIVAGGKNFKLRGFKNTGNATKFSILVCITNVSGYACSSDNNVYVGVIYSNGTKSLIKLYNYGYSNTCYWCKISNSSVVALTYPIIGRSALPYGSQMAGVEFYYCFET